MARPLTRERCGPFSWTKSKGPDQIFIRINISSNPTTKWYYGKEQVGHILILIAR